MQVQWVHSRSENSAVYKQSSSSSSIPFHTHPEVTLCSWQVVKIQELFSVLHKSILGQALHIWLWKKKCKICVCSFWSWAKMQMLSGTVNWLPLLVPSVGLLCDGCTCMHVHACMCVFSIHIVSALSGMALDWQRTDSCWRKAWASWLEGSRSQVPPSSPCQSSWGRLPVIGRVKVIALTQQSVSKFGKPILIHNSGGHQCCLNSIKCLATLFQTLL